jgi:energy-coupling factor transporter transmembrane protein EcfT
LYDWGENVGALAFFILMAVVFFVAIFFIILSVILLLVRSAKIRKGRTVKKRWFVIPVVVLVVSMIAAMIPVGFIVFLRYENGKKSLKLSMLNQEKRFYWPMGEYQSNTGWFEMDGVKYVRFGEGELEHTVFLSETEDKRGKPVANISTIRQAPMPLTRR